MRKTTQTSPSSSTRQLNLEELEQIVGGVAAATAAVKREQVDHLIQQDLVGHDAGQDHSKEIANMIAAGAISVKDAIHDIEANAAKDGKHSVDQQLTHIHDALKTAHATAASALFAQEEDKRLGSGVAAQDLARLIAKGAMSGATAAHVLQDEARVSGSHKLGAATSGLETATGGNAAVEVALGNLVKSGQVAAGDAIRTVEHAAQSSHHSIDQALTNLDAGAGYNKTIEAEERNRVQSHATEADLASALQHHTISGSAALNVLASQVSHGVIKEGNAIAVLLAVEKSGAVDASIENELGHRIRAHDVSAAAVIAAVEAGAAKAHVSIDQTLRQIDAAAGRNAAIEAEQIHRVQTHAMEADVAAAMKHGKITGPAAVSMIENAAALAHTSIDQSLLRVNAAVGHNGAIEAELIHRVQTHAMEASVAAAMKQGKLSGPDAIAVIEQSAALAHMSIDQALGRVNAAVGHNGALEGELIHRVQTHAMESDVAAAMKQGKLSGPDAVAVIEKSAALAHVSIDQALGRVNAAVGHNGALEAELVRRVQSHAMESDVAAAMKQGKLSGPDAVAVIEKSAALAHVSIDQALGRVNAAVGHNGALEAELIRRVQSHAMESDVAGAMKQGKLNGPDAVAVIEKSAALAHVSIDQALGRVNASLGHNAALEAELVRRVQSHAMESDVAAAMKSGKISGADAVAVIEKSAALAHMSIDQALDRVNSSLGHNAALEAEMRHRVQTHAIDSDLAASLQRGTITGAAAVSLLASQVSHGVIKESNAIAVLLAVEKSGVVNAAIETELGHRVNTRDVSAAAAIAAVEAGAAKAHTSVDQALLRLNAGAGHNSAIQAELIRRVQSHAMEADVAAAMKQGKLSGPDAVKVIEGAAALAHVSADQALDRVNSALGHNGALEAEMRNRAQSGAAETDLIAALKRGTISGAAAVSTLASEVSHGGIKEKDAIRVLLAAEATAANTAIETELAHRVKSGEVSAAMVIAAVEAGATSVPGIVDALNRIDAASGRNSAIDAELHRMQTVKSVYGILDNIISGKMTAYNAVSAVSQTAHSQGGQVQPADLLKAAAAYLRDDQHAAALMELAKVALFNNALKDSDQSAVNDAVVKEMAQPGHALNKFIFSLADDVSHGKISADAAGAALMQAGRSLPWGTSTFDMLKAAVTQSPDSQHSLALAKLAKAASDSYAIGDHDLAIVQDMLVQTMVKSADHPDLNVLIPLLITNVGLGGTTEEAARSYIKQCAAFAGNADDWLLAALQAAGGVHATGNSVATDKVVLGIVEVMAERLQSGALVADISSRVLSGHMSAADAAGYVRDFARTAVANTGFDATGYLQVGGVSADGRAGHALHDLIIATHGNVAVEQAVAKEAIAINMDRHLLVDAVAQAAGSSHLAQLSAIVRMDGYLGGADSVFAHEIGNRLTSGAVADIEKAVHDKVLTAAAASELLATAIEQVSQQPPSANFEKHLTDRLHDGVAEADLVRAVALGNISVAGAIAVASEAVKLAQAQSGAPVLAGAAEAQFVLAKLDDAAQSGGGAELHQYLQDHYGLALSVGRQIMPLVEDLGFPLAAAATATGSQLAAHANPTDGVEAKLIVDLEKRVTQAGGSIDAALALAGMNAVGRSEVLKLEMTDRLLSGKAENDIARLDVQGKLDPAHAAGILLSEVQVLTAGSAQDAALGFDHATANDFVLAKLALAAEKLQPNPQADAAAKAAAASDAAYNAHHAAPIHTTVSFDRAPTAGRAGDLQRYLETTHTKELIAGLGAVCGLLAIDAVNNRNAIATAKAMAQRLVPDVIKESIHTGSMTAEEAKHEISVISQENVQAFTNTYAKAYNLASFERQWTLGEKKEGLQVSGSLQTYNFTELGADVGVSTSLTTDLGAGFSLTLSAEAAAHAGVTVNATQVTIEAAAGAAASAEIDLGSHAKFVMLAQAIASGSVVAGVTGVAVTGNVAVGASVGLSQTEQGSLGHGFDGMQTTELTAGVIAGASGTGSIGLDNKVAFDAKVGSFVAVGEHASISYGGVTIGGGVTVAAPGVLGAELNADVNFEGGDIHVNITGFLGIELFGLGFNLDFTLPTGKVIDALKPLGGVFESAGKAFASGITDFGDALASGAQSFASGASDFFTGKLFGL